MARGDRGGGHRLGRVVPGGTVAASRSRHAASRTRSMWCASRTVASTRCAAGCRTRRSGIGAANTIRCIGSASCCSRVRNVSTNAGKIGCCSDSASVTLTTRCSARGSPRNPCATCISPTIPTKLRCCSTRPSPAAPTTTSPRSSRSGARSPRGATEILAHHHTGARNGPTEGLNLCVKKVKRCGHGFRSFEHYRLRVLLHAGGVTWPERPSPPRIRTRAPYSDA